MPDFARLSRKDALGAINDFEQLARTKHGPAVDKALELLRGLRDLDRRVIPNEWVA